MIKYQIFVFPGNPKIILKIPVEYGCAERCLELAERLEYKVRHETLGMGVSNDFRIHIPFIGSNGFGQLKCRCEIVGSNA